MSIKEIARELLRLEHWNYALQLGMIEGEIRQLDAALLKKAIYAIDELRWQDEAFSHRLATQLIAITWEHSSLEQKQALREYFIVTLSRLGIAPSTGMIDPEYAESGIYSPVSSFFTELQTITLQSPHEINIGQSRILLTQFQLDVLNAIKSHRLIGISAPTSAGKSFAIYLAITSHIAYSTASVIYIVPTLSLVSQVSRDIRAMLKSTGSKVLPVYTTYHPAAEQSIFVLTQERAMGAIEEDSLPEKGFLVVDEVQNLERVAQEDDHRSKVLFDLLKDLKDSGRLEKIVLSGPRLSNIGNVGFEIFGEPSDEQESQISPVVNITYAIEHHKDSYWLNQYVDTLESPNTLAITNKDVIAGYGQSLYTDKFLDYLTHLLNSLGPSSRNIIFSPTAPQARNTAYSLSEKRPSISSDPRAASLAEYLRRTVHPSYTLAGAIQKSVGYHTGRVPMHARAAIEEAFKSGVIKDLVCTTTLMQGVNLPATTVIVRNPNLFVRKGKMGAARLSPYEFANLRGRAGRLLKDFIGRTVVLDASSFAEEESQEDLFRDEYKDLYPGYYDAFEANRYEVIQELDSPTSASVGPHKYLVTYIRQTLLRMGSTGIHRLRDVGIYLSDQELAQTIKALEALTIPHNLALRHRYWDPFDLELLYLEVQRRGLDPLPSNSWESDIGKLLHRIVSFHAEHLKYYYDRSIGDSTDEKYIWAVCLSAEQWAREAPLREILDRRNFQDKVADKIDDQIQLLMTKVVYGLPTLLKPYADITSQGSALLASIEWGAFHPVTRLLIERGVARDTAIVTRLTLFGDLTGKEEGLDNLISSRFADKLNELGYWERKQIADAFLN
ncbi:DEAD/DEAH box helicase [Thioalbus denitrificans]|uniref:Replicative superfamily II helicase n=1 Tax=Thioalbus denitrificans TaxID=547122 RepID=A0A369C1F0_9GAMM|nr:DEAD/DEAH box helicase [Thioalbus denitrificans]RCX26497.1 replicative superfamily II helicase [Thioalbus denitrificans]